MQRNFTLSLLGFATFFSWGLHAQQTVVLPSRSTGGPSVITNYATTGPGLPTSSLFETRLAQPLGVPTVSAPGGSMPAPMPIPNEAATIPGNQPLLNARARAAGFGGATRQHAFAAPEHQGEFISGHRNNCRDGFNAPSFIDEPPYTFPGLVTRFAGNWVGSEYLYNMPSDIGIAVDVVAPDRFPMTINLVRIKDAVAEIFANHGINPTALSAGDMPPLPFFHVLVFIQNAEEGSVAFVAGRLFEGVRLLRLDYPLPGSAQAITWEQQDLLVDSINRIENQIVASAQNIAKSFVDNVAYFERHRLEQEELLRLRCTNFDMRTSAARVAPVAAQLPLRSSSPVAGPPGRLGGPPRMLSAPSPVRSSSSSPSLGH